MSQLLPLRYALPWCTCQAGAQHTVHVQQNSLRNHIKFLGQLQLSCPCTITFRKGYTLCTMNKFKQVIKWLCCLRFFVRTG